MITRTAITLAIRIHEKKAVFFCGVPEFSGCGSAASHSGQSAKCRPTRAEEFPQSAVGGEESRSNIWLAELQQHMFAEINPADANDNGIKHNQQIWLEGPEGGRILIRAFITRRVGRGVVFTPFHFGGWFEGKDLLDKYPEGAAPYIRGEAANTVFTYGYDSVTQMQETKCSLCKIWAA